MVSAICLQGSRPRERPAQGIWARTSGVVSLGNALEREAHALWLVTSPWA